MLKNIQIILCLAVLATAALSCKSGDNDARDAAKQGLEAQAVQPATQTPAGAQDAAATPAAPTGPTTSMSFAETTFDFGTVNEGEMVSHTYQFTNTGDVPLVLSDAKGSCGCTVPQWPREPIAPGATAEIKVEFNSKNKKGKRNQKVTITANTNPPQTFIYLTGEVTPAAGEAPAVTQ